MLEASQSSFDGISLGVAILLRDRVGRLSGFPVIGRLVSDSLPARRLVTTATEKAGQAE